jgi:hypothetical protein
VSYVVEQSAVVDTPRSRPVLVTLAAVLLGIMGLAGLVYAVAVLLLASPAAFPRRPALARPGYAGG